MQSPQIKILLRPPEIRKLKQTDVNLFDKYVKTHGPVVATDPHVVATQMEKDLYDDLKDLEYKLAKTNGILIPGGFGKRGVEGKILSVQLARAKKIPFFGICFGMQISVIELARSLLGLKDSNSTELSNTKNPIVCLMEEWIKGKKILKGEKFKIGGTMRLGSYPAKVKKDSLLYKIYGNKTLIHERHRHRYEVNISYKSMLEKKGVVFSANSPDGKLPEAIELKDHPWFVGVQFHPELKSRPFSPHKIFISFIDAAIKNKNLNS